MSVRLFILFISYSHVDEALRDRLEVHLAALKRESFVDVWHDRRIGPGEDWAGKISENLESADIVLALVSPDFIASDYCWGTELTRALERHAEGLARVIPIILRPCDWKRTPLNRLHALPRDGKPVTTWDDRDEAFLDVARGLGVEIDKLTTHPAGPLRERIYVNLPNTGQRLFGREAELEDLDAAWKHSDKQRIVSLVATGGVGKTSLVKAWLDRLSRDGYRGAERVFAWSFYLQGTDSKEISADLFLDRAFAFFGLPPAGDEDSSHDRGVRLAHQVRNGRNLLVLDGLEPLQYPPGRLQGQLKDPALTALFRQLAAANRGLCVVTTRIPIPEIAGLEDAQIELRRLSPKAGTQLLRHLGVQGTDAQLCEASVGFKGHALALTLLGAYLVEIFDGNVARWQQIPPPGDDDPHGYHAIRVMRSYENWLAEKPEQLAVLRLLGLFHRPASYQEIEAVLEEPGIPDLTEPLAPIFQSPIDWQRLIWNVRETRLLAERSSRDATSLDAHPMVRQYFGDRLRAQSPDSWREGHRRLFYHHEHAVLARRGVAPTNFEPEDFRELLAAVVHGCRAGCYEEALNRVYRGLVIQNHHSFHERRFSVPSALVTGISEFFEPVHMSPVRELSDRQKAFVQEELGHCLFLLGRLTEALEPLRKGIEAREELGEHELASKHARLVRETYLMLGKLDSALEYAEKSVELAAKTERCDVLMRQKAGLGQVLHWQGEWRSAEVWFRDAERELMSWRKELGVLYSYYGFWYCELLLDRGEAAANGDDPERALALFAGARGRAEEAIKVARCHGWRIDLALDELTLGRSLLLEAICRGSNDLTRAHQLIDHALEGLQQAGQKHYLVRGFLGRAGLQRYLNHLDRAELDANEALEIAQACRMTPFEVDARLDLCCLDLIRDTAESRTKARANLDDARRIMTETGYFRRHSGIEAVKNVIDSRRAVTIVTPLALRCRDRLS